MQYQDVETNSVADLQVAISDDEEAEYFAVDEGPVSDAFRVQPPAISAAALPGGAVHQPSFPGPSVCDSSAVIRSHRSVVADTRVARGDDARGVEIDAARGVEIGAAHAHASGIEIDAAHAHAPDSSAAQYVGLAAGNTSAACSVKTERLGAGSNPEVCLLYTSPSPRDGLLSRMPSSA